MYFISGLSARHAVLGVSLTVLLIYLLHAFFCFNVLNLLSADRLEILRTLSGTTGRKPTSKLSCFSTVLLLLLASLNGPNISCGSSRRIYELVVVTTRTTQKKQ